MRKKVRVQMLPTGDNTSLIFDNKNGNLFYTTSKNVPLNYQHLYFTSDEKIEVGDYITDGYRAWRSCRTQKLN
jgi:hypothetical protein